jgi:hypothetical protein
LAVGLRREVLSAIVTSKRRRFDMRTGVCLIAVLLLCGARPALAEDVIYSFPLDSDPGWTADAEWAFGIPAGQGGTWGGPDPTSGHTGDYVYGYNLYGDYPNDLSPTRWLTTSALDFSGCTGVTLHFYRWLGVEAGCYDHAYIQASNDGENWSTVWENPHT